MAKLKHDSGSTLENTRIIRARLPGALNMVIVARKPASSRERHGGVSEITPRRSTLL